MLSIETLRKINANIFNKKAPIKKDEQKKKQRKIIAGRVKSTKLQVTHQQKKPKQEIGRIEKYTAK